MPAAKDVARLLPLRWLAQGTRLTYTAALLAGVSRLASDVSSHVLVFGVGSKLCALPIASVVETLRPLPCEPLAGAPPFVLGVSAIRGAPVPVIDGRLLLGRDAGGPPGRLVSLRLGERRAALAVDRVEGVRQLDAQSQEKLPPLLKDVAQDSIEAISRLDGALLLVLRASRLLELGA